MFYNENLYYLLCSCANSVFGKNLVPEIEAKMVSANQIPGFLNQCCYIDDFHAGTSSGKLKVDSMIFRWTW